MNSMPSSNEWEHKFLKIENDGQKLVSTNWFDSPHGKKFFFLSYNAGAARLLMPDVSRSALAEMKTGKQVKITQYADCVDIVFDDGSSSPYGLQLNYQGSDRVISDNCRGIFRVILSDLSVAYEAPFVLKDKRFKEFPFFNFGARASGDPATGGRK